MTPNVVSRRSHLFIPMRPSVSKHLKVPAGDTNPNAPLLFLPTGMLVVMVTEAAAADLDLHPAGK